MRSLSLLGTTLAYWKGKRLEVTVAVSPPDPTEPGGPHGEAAPTLQHRGRLRQPSLGHSCCWPVASGSNVTLIPLVPKASSYLLGVALRVLDVDQHLAHAGIHRLHGEVGGLQHGVALRFDA